jgi:hypothetical protein
LASDVFVEVLPPVKVCGQSSEDHVGLVSIADGGYDLEELIQSQQSKETGIDRDDCSVGDSEPIERGSSHRWRCVDDDNVEVAQDGLQFRPQEQVTVYLLGFEQIVGNDVDRVGEQLQSWARLEEEQTDVGLLVDEETVSREFESVEINTEST